MNKRVPEVRKDRHKNDPRSPHAASLAHSTPEASQEISRWSQTTGIGIIVFLRSRRDRRNCRHAPCCGLNDVTVRSFLLRTSYRVLRTCNALRPARVRLLACPVVLVICQNVPIYPRRFRRAIFLTFITPQSTLGLLSFRRFTGQRGLSSPMSNPRACDEVRWR